MSEAKLTRRVWKALIWAVGGAGALILGAAVIATGVVRYHGIREPMSFVLDRTDMNEAWVGPRAHYILKVLPALRAEVDDIPGSSSASLFARLVDRARTFEHADRRGRDGRPITLRVDAERSVALLYNRGYLTPGQWESGGPTALGAKITDGSCGVLFTAEQFVLLQGAQHLDQIERARHLPQPANLLDSPLARGGPWGEPVLDVGRLIRAMDHGDPTESGF